MDRWRHLDHVSKSRNIKTFTSLFRYTQSHQPRKIDTRVPFVEQGFQLVTKKKLKLTFTNSIDLILTLS